MTDDHSVIHSRSSPRWKSSFSLASLLAVLTICAILFAWFVDHRRLVKQIGSPPKKLTFVYRLSNASTELATQRLKELFKSDTIISEKKSNSVIVMAEQIDHDRMHMIIRFMDREDTEFVETETQVSKLENDSLQTKTK